jgi:two-component system, sensor histidine kinase PdtaS
MGHGKQTIANLGGYLPQLMTLIRPIFLVNLMLLVLGSFSIRAQNPIQSKIDSLQLTINKTENQDSILILLSEQLSLAKKLGDTKQQAEIEMRLGNASDYEGFDKEQHHLNALAIYEQLKDTTGIIKAIFELSQAKQLQNDYDSTRVYTEMMIGMAELAKDNASIIKGRLMLSSLYNHLALYTKSLEELNKGRILAESIKDDESIIIDILNKESFTYYSLAEYDKSAEKIKQIIEFFKKDDNPRRLNIWMNNLASVYSLCDNCVTYKVRKDILKESIGYAERANFIYGKAFAYKHLSDVYKDAGEYDSSKYYLDRIEVLLPEINKKDFTGLVSVAQGSYWNRMGNTDKGIFYFKKAYNIWEEIGRQNDLLTAARVLNDLYAKKKDFNNAYKYLKTYVSLKDTLYNEENIKKVKELELSYDFRQTQITDSLRNQEKINLLEIGYNYEAQIQKRSKYALVIVLIAIIIIAALIYTNYKKQKALAALLKIKSDEVENELSHKKLLLTEIHHRVKNNFQVLSSLLELQSRGTNDQATRNLISEGKSRVNSMALIHNQLYNADSLRVNLAEYLKNLIAEVEKSFTGKSSEVDLNVDTNFEMDVDNMIPLGLIANELVTNAYKYAGDKGLVLSISLKHQGENHILIIKDNGSGLPKNFDLSSTKSTGLWLVSRLALQLHGKYEYEFEEGAVFKVYFTQSDFTNF